MGNGEGAGNNIRFDHWTREEDICKPGTTVIRVPAGSVCRLETFVWGFVLVSLPHGV
jgi:hypothetical protein